MKMLLVKLAVLTMATVCIAGDAEKITAEIFSTRTIAQQEGRYMGWSTIAKLPDGRLMVAFSGDRDWHVCPWGKNQAVTSGDNGKTWSDIITINNTPLDDRDAGLLVTDKGTVIISWFTSLEFANKTSSQYKTRYFKYDKHSEKTTPEIREQWFGYWVRRSADNGKTWGEYIKTPGTSPHGPIQLKDGRLLYVTNSGVAESKDDGLSWQVIGAISADESKGEKLSEIHAVEADDGTIVAHNRYQGDGGDRYLRQSVSTDGGKTWSTQQKTEMLGYPAHLIKLSNGWLLSTYSRRVAPMGQRACISKDNGKTWLVEDEITLCVAAPQPGADLGYPSTVELDDGTLYTVYYQQPADADQPAIMATHWKINSLK